MIKPAHNKIYERFFDMYFTYILKHNFRKISIEGDFIPDDRSILLVPNHFSWWDGFFAWKLNTKLLKKKFYLMMLERELAKRLFFTKLGAFSISYTSKEMIKSLRFATEVLKEPNNLLVFYPQGKLFSQHHKALKFQRGIEWIVKQSKNFRLLMCVNLIDYYAYPKPSLTIYLQEYRYLTDFNLSHFQLSYNLFLERSIQNQDKIFRQ